MVLARQEVYAVLMCVHVQHTHVRKHTQQGSVASTLPRSQPTQPQTSISSQLPGQLGPPPGGAMPQQSGAGNLLCVKNNFIFPNTPAHIHTHTHTLTHSHIHTHSHTHTHSTCTVSSAALLSARLKVSNL